MAEKIIQKQRTILLGTVESPHQADELISGFQDELADIQQKFEICGVICNINKSPNRGGGMNIFAKLTWGFEPTSRTDSMELEDFLDKNDRNISRDDL